MNDKTVTESVILLKQVEPGIYLLTINRPKVLNALNTEVIQELGAAIGQVARDDGARILLLTGAGDKAFAAGADIAQMRNFSGMEAQEFSERGVRLMRRLETLAVPTIAVVNGYCLGGGCELAMSCDWILASERAVFGQPEVNLGVPPGFGGTQRLLRLVGRNIALELIATGRQVKAEEAKAIGLANQIYPADQLMNKALEMARTIASKGPVAVRLSKQLVQRGQDLDLVNACVLESNVFGLAFSTEDQKEGMTAFLEKRKARFAGR